MEIEKQKWGMKRIKWTENAEICRARDKQA